MSGDFFGDVKGKLLIPKKIFSRFARSQQKALRGLKAAPPGDAPRLSVILVLASYLLNV